MSNRVDHALILQIVKGGETYRQAAAKLGCSTSYVYKICGAAGVENPSVGLASGKSSAIAARNHGLVEAYLQGASLAGLAASHGISQSRVLQIVGRLTTGRMRPKEIKGEEDLLSIRLQTALNRKDHERFEIARATAGLGQVAFIRSIILRALDGGGKSLPPPS